ncbi:MAG: hypothetical protein MOGMAGMI_00998 [Candidatus Omnitrophica bacterium]|nr:hypothetical protein [Candidatus Omnitrophota bacterium]
MQSRWTLSVLLLMAMFSVSSVAEAALMKKKSEPAEASQSDSGSSVSASAEVTGDEELDMSEQDLKDEKELQDLEREIAREGDDLFDPTVDIPQNPNLNRTPAYTVEVNPNVGPGALNPNAQIGAVSTGAVNPGVALANPNVQAAPPVNPNVAANPRNPNTVLATPRNPNVGAVPANPNNRE